MVRHVFHGKLGGEPYFRWRGGDVSRLEALTDGAFAVALTLLIVSEVPRTFDQLWDVFRGLPVFAATFAILVMCWVYHYRFHRRYGLEDNRTLALNALFLFLILFYVYPLKFLFSWLIHPLVGLPTSVPGPDGVSLAMMERGPDFAADMQRLMLIYSGGFAAIFGVLALMHANAWRLRAELELDSAERVLTKGALHGHLLSVGLAVTSMAMAASTPKLNMWAGLLYGLMGPIHGVHGWLTGRAVERYKDKLPGAPAPPLET